MVYLMHMATHGTSCTTSFLGVSLAAVVQPNATLIPLRNVTEVMSTMLGTVNTSRSWPLQRLGQRETLTNAQLTNPPAVLNDPTGGTGVNVYVLSSVGARLAVVMHVRIVVTDHNFASVALICHHNFCRLL